jgi:competence protein ComEA
MAESAQSGAWRALEDDQAQPGAGQQHASNEAAVALSRRLPAVWIVALLALAAVLAGAALWLVLTSGHGSIVVEGDGPGPARSGDPARVAGATSVPGSGDELVIDVQGAVLRPGIVHLPRGARVADAIAAAGGYGSRVAADRVGQALNLAAELKDGDQVTVPSRDDPVGSLRPGGGTGGGGGSSGGGGSGSAGPVDLNHATAAELDALPGIGPVTATKIIAARDEQPFTTVDELRSRKILGEATFDKVKDLVVVR